MTSSGQRTSVSALLEKMKHYDKDERYMATSDLCELLKRQAPMSSTTQQLASSSMSIHDSAHIHIDATTEQRICIAILTLLDDPSNDVQTVAVKTLVQLFQSVHHDQIVDITHRLSTLILDKSKDALRDVYSDGLQKLVHSIPPSMGDSVSKTLLQELVTKGILRNADLIGTPSPPEDKNRESTAEDITVSCLDVLTAMLTRFGSLPTVIPSHKTLLMDAFLPQLGSSSALVRKKVSNAIGQLSTVISDTLLFHLVESLLGKIDVSGASGLRRSKRRKVNNDMEDSPSRKADTMALIQTMCTVSGMVGHRLGQKQIDRIVPIFLRFCNPKDATAGNEVEDSEDDEDASMEDSDNEDDASMDEAAMSRENELRESCFTGFQSFVLKCPVYVQPYLPEIIHAALAYMRHDPNYSYDDDDDDDDEEEDCDMDSDEEEEDDYDDEDYDDDDEDDDDDSWKVRRSAIRTLAAVVQASKHDLGKIWIDEYAWKKNKSKKATMAGALVEMFKERVENCRVDIIKCFESLLTNTLVAYKMDEVVLVAQEDSSTMDVDMGSSGGSDSQVTVELQSKVTPAVVNACVKQLSAKKGGAPTKTATLSLLSVLCDAPGGLGDTKLVESVLTHIQSILGTSSGDIRQGSSKALKLDALCLVRSIIGCKYHNVVELKNGIVKSILSDICQAVQEHWYKVIAEALRVLTKIPPLLIASNSDKEEMTTVAGDMYKAIEPRLAAHDLDQEVKECALDAAASLLSTLHSSLDDSQKNQLLLLLLQRLKNETTSIAAMKAITEITENGANGMEQLDLSSILSDSIAKLASLLSQNTRGIKQNALQCLTVIVRSQYGQNTTIYDGMLKEVSENIVDTDLHICHLSLNLSVAVLEVSSSSGPSFKENILPAALSLSTSPLLQDAALDSLLDLLGKSVQSNAVVFNELLQALQSRVHGGVKQVITNLAKCIAAVTVAASPPEREAVISNLLASLESEGNTDMDGVQLALRVSGDVGRIVDLSELNGATDRLQKIYFSFFDSPSDDVKNAAAYGLGRAAVRATSSFLPGILSALENKDQQRRQYLLLSALHELIHCHQIGPIGDISPSVLEILPHLKEHCADKDDAVRTMVAECIGSLICVSPDGVLPQIQILVSEHGGKPEAAPEEDKTDALVCATVANSVKYAIAGHCDTQKLFPYMPAFLPILKEKDLSARNAALLMVYSCVHHSPTLVIGLMEEHVMPHLVECAKLKLKRQVDLGPFKQTFDDALPLRKASISIFAKCLDKCPGTVDLKIFLPLLVDALGDVEDIQLQAHQILSSMCSRFPREIVASIDTFVTPLEKTISKRMGQRTGTELERAQEWVKSAVRVTVLLSRVDMAMSNPTFVEFIVRVKKSQKHEAMLKEVEEDLK